MRIAPPREEIVATAELRRQMEALLAAPGPGEQRPCPGCTMTCHRCGSTGCTCHCSPDCANATTALSEEPVRHPIEPRMTPLVYQLNALRVFQPCWSCEGHVAADGTLLRPPQVSFYAAAESYVQLLMRHLRALHLRGTLVLPWRIELADFGQRFAPMYCLGPDLDQVEDVSLARLQQDLTALTKDLRERILEGARGVLAELERY